jgi:hypothetical protein
VILRGPLIEHLPVVLHVQRLASAHFNILLGGLLREEFGYLVAGTRVNGIRIVRGIRVRVDDPVSYQLLLILLQVLMYLTIHQLLDHG